VGATQSDGAPRKNILWSAEPVVFSEEMNLRARVARWSQNVYPMGNGRLGFTVFGDPDTERIQFNEDSLWLGNEDYPGGYQPFGDVYVKLGHKAYTNYQRVLDIENAVQTVTYESGGVQYTREYFASYPAQVMVFRFSADTPGALSGEIWLDSMHRSKHALDQDHPPELAAAISTTASKRTLTLKGANKDLFWWRVFLEKVNRKDDSGKKQRRGREYGSDEIIDLDYEAQVRVLNEGGTVKVEGDRIVFDTCDSLTLLLAADTSYLNQRDKGWRTTHPHARVSAQIEDAAKQLYPHLRKQHVDDYQRLFNRFDIDLGSTHADRQTLPTAERVATYAPGNDPELEALMYQYARYLMLSCSRPGHGGLPANLQGLWLFHIRPAWLCDYHTDINLQMNYWFVDQANIGECFTPLAEWVESIREVRKEETRKVLGVKRGWLMRSENGVFGGSSYFFQKGDSAWISQNLWDHYAFTQDKDYLKQYAYPVMKEISEFWVDHLKALPDGTLVAPDGRSPEHGPEKSDGVSYDQQLCWDLFSNTIEASVALGVDAGFRKELTEKRAKLLGPKIGKWGQLQEWMEDIDDPEDTHRHINHMIAVYPGRQIHPTTTPAFAEAAKVGLIARGNGPTGWSKVWKICIFARLLESEHAYRMLADVLQTKTHGNLWTTHPPFQIDCNFGYPAGVNEMLVQSHLTVGKYPNTPIPKDPNLEIQNVEPGTANIPIIQLLPALPKAWKDGHVEGMRVRGGFELDMEWKDGTLTKAALRGVSNDDASCIVRYNDKQLNLVVKSGAETTLGASDFE
jgi:alpha-L-fucosidase 2